MNPASTIATFIGLFTGASIFFASKFDLFNVINGPCEAAKVPECIQVNHNNVGSILKGKWAIGMYKTSKENPSMVSKKHFICGKHMEEFASEIC